MSTFTRNKTLGSKLNIGNYTVYGWAVTGGYLLLDTGVEYWTGKTIGEHLNDYTREEYGFDTVNMYSWTLK